MSLADSSKQERIEEFLRKSLLGEELINTQFHLFSARSHAVSPTRLARPRVLCANNLLLAKSSKYFLDLLSSDINPSDPGLSDLTDADDIPSSIDIDDYGYASDSDLDDDEEEPSILTTTTEPSKDRSAIAPTSPPKISVNIQPKDDDESSDDGSESVSSDMFVMSPEHPRMDEPFTINLDVAGSVTSNDTTVQEAQTTKVTASHTSARLRSLGSRHILVRDTAFQTWYTLLNYLYTGKISFVPLSSAAPRGLLGDSDSSTSSMGGPRCSAKSMYRLACKVGLDDLRDEALAHIRNSLTEQNILKELSCSLASKYPELLQMELDAFYTYIASPSVVTAFPALAQRIANKELLHGAEIIVGIHERLLKGPLPPMSPISAPLSPSIPSSRTPPGPFSLRGSPAQETISLVGMINEPEPPLSAGVPIWGNGWSGFGAPLLSRCDDECDEVSCPPPPPSCGVNAEPEDDGFMSSKKGKPKPSAVKKKMKR